LNHVEQNSCARLGSVRGGRVVGGSVVISPDAPFLVERFNSLIEGSARFGALDRTLSPMLYTAPDGNVLLVYMRHSDAAKGRAVGH
jgi:hypothetical protein